MTPFTKFMKEIGYAGRETEFAACCHHYGFMILPYEPSVADITALQRDGVSSKAAAKSFYYALVNRRSVEPDVQSPNIPSRVDVELK